MKRKLLFVLAFLCVARPARAEDIDKSRDLWQNLDRSTRQREASVLTPEEQPAATAEPPAETMDANQTSLALFMAINRGDWPEVAKLLEEYRKLKDHDPALALFAEAALARSRGDFRQAERGYRNLLAQRPEFVRARLDLARLLFENWKNKEAEREFTAIDKAVLPEAVITNIDAYLKAIALRRGVHGSFSLGTVHSDNLNRSSRSSDCLWYNPDGSCFFERTVPDAVKAYGIAYDGTLAKRFELAGHQSIVARVSMYGNTYGNEQDYNETNLSVSVGYSYRDLRNDISVSPLFEYDLYADESLYLAPGARMVWNRVFSPQLTGNVQLDYKYLSYMPKAYRHNDGAQTALYSTVVYMQSEKSALFGGIDAMRQDAHEKTNAYRQAGLRLGLYHRFDAGFTLTATGALRHKKHHVYNAILEARREDTEQIYTLILGVPRFALAGFTPMLMVKHNRVQSNIDWLYSYRQNEVTLKLERYF